MQMDPSLVHMASPQEMERAAKKMLETMWVDFNKRQDRIVRVVSKLTGAEIFNVYEMVRNISSEETLFHTINLCLTSIFAVAFMQCSIPMCQFNIYEMEELVAAESRKQSRELKNGQ